MCIVLIGRLGKDAEIVQTSNGNKYVRFTVAENTYTNKENETTWYDVVSYDAFVVNTQIQVLKKGAFVVVTGRLKTKVNVGKNGNVYLNHNVTAWNINVPNLSGGDKKDSENITKVVSNATPTIPLDRLENKDVTPVVPVQETTQPINATDIINTSDDDGDELPF